MLVGKYVFVIFLSLYVIRNFRGTCPSVEMLKGYMARVSLGTPALRDIFLLECYTDIVCVSNLG